MNSSELSKSIKRFAKEEGFSACGIAVAEKLSSESTALKKWLDSGYHASMNWMEGHFDKRVDPRLLVEDTLSIVVVALPYKPAIKQPSHLPQVASYAYGEDYHHIIKNKLRKILDRINSELCPVSGRVFTDSAPILERDWAVRAGLGWRGKNSLLITKGNGSMVLLGEMLLSIELEADTPFEKNHCGSCKKCIDSCPNGAIVAPGVVDSNRCISYLTIEHRGDFENNNSSNKIFGCDICQDCCPWNSSPPSSKEPAFKIKPFLLSADKEAWNNLSPAEFKSIFKDSPISRTKLSGVIRNLNNLK